MRRHKVKTGQVIPLTDKVTGKQFWWAVKCVDERATWVWDGNEWLTRKVWDALFINGTASRNMVLARLKAFRESGGRIGKPTARPTAEPTRPQKHCRKYKVRGTHGIAYDPSNTEPGQTT
jgi:hypothetical protein